MVWIEAPGAQTGRGQHGGLYPVSIPSWCRRHGWYRSPAANGRRTGVWARMRSTLQRRLPPLPQRRRKRRDLRLFGWTEAAASSDPEHELTAYGSEQGAVDALAADSPELAALVHPRLPYRLAEVVWAVRHEMARSVEDVLARRTRALFLDARAAIEAAPQVAACMARELKHEETWQHQQVEAFSEIAAGYVYSD